MGSRLSERLAFCGGSWNNGTNAGVFYVNLNYGRSNSNNNLGFRSALPRSRKVEGYDRPPCAGDKGARSLGEIRKTKTCSARAVCRAGRGKQNRRQPRIKRSRKYHLRMGKPRRAVFI